MKHEKKLSCLIGGTLAFVVALAGIGCIDSAFGLHADMERLGWYLVLWGLFSSFCFYFRRGGTVFLCACAILLGFSLREGTLEQEIESFLFHISSFYDGGYQCGVIYWTTYELKQIPVDGGLFVIAAAIQSVLTLTLCRRKNELPALLAAVVPLGICLVVTDTIPSEAWLFLLLSSLALLLLTHPVRKNRAADGIRLSAMLLIPVFLASIVLFALTPQDTYGDRMNALQQLLSSLYQQTPDDVLPGTTPGQAPSMTNKVDLSAIAEKESSERVVLEVIAEKMQTLYLRAQSYDTYDGTSWSTSQYSTGTDPYWPTEGLQNVGYVRISTKMKQEHMLLPYYIAADDWEYAFVDGKIPNEDRYQYSLYQKILTEDSAGLKQAADNSDPILQQCLQLPQDTADAAKQILSEMGINRYTDPAQAVEIIADYVRSSADYDLNTKKMPSEQTDFAIWFLQDGETGYCVHFATAATVLLRAQGIPARYVSGYSAKVQTQLRQNVTQKDAHAWVEYLDPQRGWQILETTPGFSVITPDMPEDTTPTEPTQTEPPTTPPTGPTEPTESPTGPTEPTESPTEPSTAPTEPTDLTEPTDTTDSEGVGLIGTGDGQGRVDWEQLRPIIVRILGVLLAVTLFIAQRGLRIRYRKKRMYSGNTNQQALARWRQVLRVRRLVDEKIPAQLRELAEKAAFSQHTLAEAELEPFDAWLDETGKILRTRPWYLRAVYKWILAVL